MSTPVHVNPSNQLGPQAATPDILAPVGWAPPETRSATSLLVDGGFKELVSTDDDVVVMPIADALTTFPWVQELMFSLIDPSEDPLLEQAFENTDPPLGTFTWVKDGAVLDQPTQSFTVMTIPQERQFIHDITVIGKDARVDSVSGSAVPPALSRGTHVSISETFIGDGAQVRSIDVDRWGKRMEVYSWDRTRIGANASSSSISVAVSAVGKHKSDSHTIVGENSALTSHTIVLAPAGTERDMSTNVQLDARGAQAEQISRMVSDGGHLRNVNTLTASADGVRGFLECSGLMLSDAGRIESIPALDSLVDQAQLSHEASVGMIDDEKLDYLMAAGLDEDAARDLIVQGFLQLEDDRIPSSIREQVEKLIEAAREAENM